MIPVVVVDFKVYTWRIHHLVTPLIQSGMLNEGNQKKLIKSLWAYYINRGPLFMEFFPHRIVMICDERDDDGDYWRNKAMRKDPEIINAWRNWLAGNKRRKEPVSYEYKGTRGDREAPDIVFEIGVEYCEKYIGKVFSEPGFEADDFAQVIYNMKKTDDGVLKDRQLYLSTIDRDWSQLVDDDLKIAFANTRRPGQREKIQDQLVTNQGVIEHTEHYSKCTIEHPSQLAQVKHLVGDKGDNLPALAPIRYFDLINPQPDYVVTKDLDLLYAELSNLESNQQLSHMKQSYNLIVQMGFPHFVEN